MVGVVGGRGRGDDPAHQIHRRVGAHAAEHAHDRVAPPLSQTLLVRHRRPSRLAARRHRVTRGGRVQSGGGVDSAGGGAYVPAMPDDARQPAGARSPDPPAVDREGPRPGADQTPARTLSGYIRLMSGRRQIGLAALALAAAGLNLAPLELQRRMVDDAIAGGDAALLGTLAALYGATLLAHQGVKYLLATRQAWVAERTAAYSRRHLLGLSEGAAAEASGPGELVSILNAEVDKLAGFVGAGPSGAAVDFATLVGVLGYLAVLDPRIALLSVALLAPQALLAPLVQRRLNRLVGRRLRLLRRLGDIVARGDGGAEPTIARILANRLAFARLKAAMKAGLNLLNRGAPLAILGFGGWLAIEGETTLGVLVAFVSGFERISGPIRDLIAFYREAEQASVQHRLIADWMLRLGGAGAAERGGAA
jgi:ABC-type multidrug transport system fused ATPase/permease subunit